MNTATEIVEKVRHALATRNYKEFANCFHTDGIYERPYALTGTIDRYEGADKIYSYIETGMAAANKLFDIIGVEAQIHPCMAEDLVFAEFFLSGKRISDSGIFKIASSAALIYCSEGKITIYRDLPNSAGISQAAGTLTQYAASLTK